MHSPLVLMNARRGDGGRIRGIGISVIERPLGAFGVKSRPGVSMHPVAAHMFTRLGCHRSIERLPKFNLGKFLDWPSPSTTPYKQPHDDFRPTNAIRERIRISVQREA